MSPFIIPFHASSPPSTLLCRLLRYRGNSRKGGRKGEELREKKKKMKKKKKKK